MTRRRALCGLLLASAVLACFGGWLWMVNGSRVRKERFEQVKKGMTRGDVIRIVGTRGADFARQMDYDRWICDDVLFVVHYDDAGTVTKVASTDDFYRPPPTFTERIRRWLGL
jgi:hypothetical protein